VRKRVRKVNVDYIKFLYGCLGFIVAQSFSSVLDARLFFSDFRHLDLPRFDCRFENWFFHYLVFLNNWFQILLFLIVMFKLNLLDMI